MLALGLEGGRVMLVDEATGEVKWAVHAHSLHSRWTKVASSLENRFLASVELSDEHWKLWDSSSGAVQRVGATHDGSGACICDFNDLGHRFLHGGCPVVAHNGGICSVSFSLCKGGRFATGGSDGAVIVWDTQTGEAEQRLQGGSGHIDALSFSADGARLASGNDEMSIRIWDAMTWALLRTIPAAHKDRVCSVSFSSPDNHTVVSGGADNQIHLWDVDSGEKRWSIEGRRFAEFSMDGRSIAIVSPNTREVRLVDAESGELRFRMTGHKKYVNSVSLSPKDGSKLASGSFDGTCKVWDSSTGALLRTIDVGHPIHSVAWGKPTTLNPKP
jgi:WD40 repeat protein